MAMAMSMTPSLAHYDDELRETIVEARDTPPYHTDPLPNPPFTFPARAGVASPTNIPSRSTHRRPHSTINIINSTFNSNYAPDMDSTSPSALPTFSFNPGATMSSPLAKLDSLLSPPMSPQSPRTIPPRAGHRRGGSEFVGGEYRAGNVKIEALGTSPTRSEPSTSPAQQPMTGPRRRGGHAHRRSAALSSHDLSSVMKSPPPPLPSPRGNSAPSSPSAEFKQSFSFPASLDNVSNSSNTVEQKDERYRSSTRQEIVDNTNIETPESSKPTPRARVGFSDTLEFIPRPLSLVSSEASSTATIRPGHSVSGSISSIISISNSIIEEPEELVFSQEVTAMQDAEERPSTAGAMLERIPSLLFSDMDSTSPPRRGSLPLLSDIAMLSPTDSNPPTPSPAITPKRWSFFGLDAFTGSSSSSPTKSRFPSEITADAKEPPLLMAVETESHPEESTNTLQRIPSRKVKKKPMKAKIWGGSILSSKSKARHGKNKRPSRRTPTPPLTRNMADSQHVFKPANDVQQLKSWSAEALSTPVTAESSVKDWKFPTTTTGDEVTYPMIDLDAALGPFNTPLPRNAEWEAAQKAGGLTKRQLHSAAGMSRFSGPGMHYNHQRAQSSPEMAPFEARRSLHRFGSSSTMADVFEEEEEEDEEDVASERSSVKPASTSGRFVRTGSMTSSNPSIRTCAITHRDAKPSGPPVSFTTRGLKRRGSDLENEHPWHHTASAKSETSSISIPDDTMAGAFKTVEYGQALTTDEPSQPSSPRATPRSKRLAPVEVGSYSLSSSSQTPISPFSATPSTAYPSPRSAVSSDAQIISTAPSSIAESNYGSLLNGEPGPELRTSMDMRTPSLMSSTSTMTRESITPRPVSQRLARPTTTASSVERPASVVSMGFNNRRGSLASLKRLISSSHGERSKLSVEVTYRDEAQEQQPKASKTKRLSRLVQFWKPKAEAEA